MKFLRIKNLFIVAILLACLASCKDKYEQESGFLGTFEPGKYEIIQYRNYDNGFKDTLTWYSYGKPYYETGSGKYYFYLNTMSFPSASWTFRVGSIVYSEPANNAGSVGRSYILQSSEIGTNEAILHYIYTNTNPNPEDYATGKLTIKRMQL